MLLLSISKGKLVLGKKINEALSQHLKGLGISAKLSNELRTIFGIIGYHTVELSGCNMDEIYLMPRERGGGYVVTCIVRGHVDKPEQVNAYTSRRRLLRQASMTGKTLEIELTGGVIADELNQNSFLFNIN